MTRTLRAKLMINCPLLQKGVTIKDCEKCKYNEYVALTEYAIECGWK